MMESVIHAPYEVNRFDLRCVPYDKKKWVDSSPERINLAIFHGALSKGGKKDTVVGGSKPIYLTYDVLSWSLAYEFHIQF